MLTNTRMCEYADTAVLHGTVGIGTPCRAVKSRTSSAVFLRLGSSVMGGRAGATARLAGALPVVPTLVRSPTLIGTGVGGSHTATRANAMNNTPALRPFVEVVNGHLQTNSFKNDDLIKLQDVASARIKMRLTYCEWQCKGGV